jgi:hypothetical protein
MCTQWLKICTHTLLAVALCTIIVTFAGAQTLDDCVWSTAGSEKEKYECGGNPVEEYGSDEAGFIFGSGVESRDGFGTLSSRLNADSYRSQRLRLSAYVKTEDVKEWAGLWMRVDGPDHQILAFDNMQNRAIRGTTDWERYEIILDVPDAAERISLGTLLAGNGKVWTGSMLLEAVDEETPVTDAGDPTASLRPPKNISEKLALFIGQWQGTIHQTMADGTEFSWPVEMNFTSILNSNSVQVEGTLTVQGDYTVDWLGLYSWDASRDRMMYYEATSTGEAAALAGNWLDAQVPTLELADIEPGETNIITQIITFPSDGEMKWEMTWGSGESITRQLLKARRQ